MQAEHTTRISGGVVLLLLAGLAPSAAAQSRWFDPVGDELRHSNQGIIGSTRHSNQGGENPDGRDPGDPDIPTLQLGPGILAPETFGSSDALGNHIWAALHSGDGGPADRLTPETDLTGLSTFTAPAPGGGATIPEPSTLLMLALGAGLLRRR